MPSLKCHQCGKVKRCKLHLEADGQTITYLCRPCARELGYAVPAVR